MFENLDEFRIELNNRIFVNRTLNLNAIEVVGFDMDYTLVLYNEAALESLAFTCALEHLISSRGYPETIRSFAFSSEKIIRGLVIDKKLGNLIKINRFGYIKAALHGDRHYSHDEQKTLYANEIVSFSNSRFEMVHTMFSLASSSLFCQLVSAADRGEFKSSYEDLYEDVNETMNQIHRNGSLKTTILADPERFVILDPDYARALDMLHAAGKKFVLITNSEWEFTQAMMSHSYDRFLGEGRSWRDLFDLVIVDSAKPAFFTGKSKFFEVIPESGHLKNVNGPIVPKHVYQGGNAAGVEAFFGVSSGDILYVGDHIYSDVHQSKKNCQWRTMLVITELEAELVSASAGRPSLERIRVLMEDKERLELHLAQLSKRRLTGFTLVKGLESIAESELQALHAGIRERIAGIDSDIKSQIDSYNSRFNRHWGELLWSGNDKSHFGMTLERYACVYTSKVSNLLFYSPGFYFRPKVKSLA